MKKRIRDLRVHRLTSVNGIVGNVTGNLTGNVTATLTLAAADGAIAVTAGTVVITKASAAALTLAAPATGDNGKRLLIISATAAAHTVTNTTPGFNGGGTAADVATFGAAIGNAMELLAYEGVWLVISLRNVTLA